MIWQNMTVGLIIIAALVVTAVRIVRFFSTPPSKCHGCSGCTLKEVTRDA